MTEWHGGAFSIGIPVDASAFYQDSRGCFHLIVRSGDKLLHYIRGSRGPFPWDNGRPILGSYKGTGQVEITSFGNLEIYWPKMNGDIIHQYADPLSFPDPSAGATVVLNPQLQVPTLTKKYGHPISISPVLVPSYGIEKDLNEALFIEDYLNRGARGGLFNSMRFFSFGVWETFTAPRVLFPYNKEGGKFNTDSRNEEWLETLDRRIGQCVERGFTPIITIIDNCSLHKKAGGWWNLHPWNGDRNVNGTSNWAPSVYHFYEEEHQGKPGIKETAKVIEAHVRFLVKRLDAKYSPHIMWEVCNESHAGEGWHRIMRDWLREEGVADDNRVSTSMDGVEHRGEYPYLTFYKKQMSRYLRYAAHGIQTIEKYYWMKDNYMRSGVNFQASEDGLKPSDTIDYRELVATILANGGFGYEGNERPWWYDNVFDPNRWDWNRIKEIALGWSDFLNG